MTSNPASRKARAMTCAPRSWPSRPTFATRQRIVRCSPSTLIPRFRGAGVSCLRGFGCEQVTVTVHRRPGTAIRAGSSSQGPRSDRVPPAYRARPRESGTCIRTATNPRLMADTASPTLGDGPSWLKDNVAAVTAVLTGVGYAPVFATFTGLIPFYPNIGKSGVNLLGHVIAVVNLAATLCLIAGWRYVKQGKIEAHAKAMTAAFGLILVFLLLYLPKVGGGGEKRLVESVPDPIALGYFVMLAIHIILSAIAMPVVLYAFLLVISHTPAELRDSLHPRVGRIAAASWILSLVLGVVTYLILNHVYSYEFV